MAASSSWELPPFLRVGTDGTGGKHTSEPRLRRCAWAAVVLCPALSQIGSITGLLTGPRQTVPRAELWGGIQTLARANDALDVELGIDASYVTKGVRSRDRLLQGDNGDLWSVFDKLIEGHSGKTTVFKVISHLEDK